MQRIKRIGVLSLGKVAGAAGFLLGGILGVLYGGILMIVGAIGAAGNGAEAAIPIFGIAILAVIALPFLYGGACFVFGLLYAVILNFVFARVGGLELEIENL